MTNGALRIVRAQQDLTDRRNLRLQSAHVPGETCLGFAIATTPKLVPLFLL